MKLAKNNLKRFCLVAVVLFAIVEIVGAKEDYYELLGVERTAKNHKIEMAFIKLAKKYHPDVNNDSNAEVEFRKIAEACAVLTSRSDRKKYDEFGHSSDGFGDFEYDFDFKEFFRDFDEQMAPLNDQMAHIDEQLSRFRNSLKNVPEDKKGLVAELEEKLADLNLDSVKSLLKDKKVEAVESEVEEEVEVEEVVDEVEEEVVVEVEEEVEKGTRHGSGEL